MTYTGSVDRIPSDGCLEQAAKEAEIEKGTPLLEREASRTLLGGTRGDKHWYFLFGNKKWQGGVSFVEDPAGYIVHVNLTGEGRLDAEDAQVASVTAQNVYAAMRRACEGTWGEASVSHCARAECSR